MYRILRSVCLEGGKSKMDQAQNLRNIVKAQQVQVSKSARLITITSGKGGVGKSSTAVNLAVQFRKLGYSVMIFDADFGLANIEVMFGVFPEYNLSDVIFHNKKIEEIIAKGPMDIGFISGGSGISELSNLSKENVRFLASKLLQLETMYDIIIVDTGAGISDTVMELVKSSKEVIVVTTPEPTSITDFYALLKALKRSSDFDSENTIIKVLANKVNGPEEARELYLKLNSVVSKFLGIKLEFLGLIPNDSHVSKAVMQQKPVSIVNENAKAARAYEKVAKGLIENTQTDIHGKVGIAQIFMNIFRSKSGK